MSTNYWIEQYNKEVLASEIELHIANKFCKVWLNPNDTEKVMREINAYLKNVGKTGYKVYVGMTEVTNGYKLTIEIP